MRKDGFGRILATSSVSARVAMSDGAHYSAAKAGVNAFIRGAAFELAHDGITVNGAEPGFIAKPGRGTMSAPEVSGRLGQYIPVGRRGRRYRLRMLYLASEQAKYTGQTIMVDGGSTLPETGFAVERHWGLGKADARLGIVAGLSIAFLAILADRLAQDGIRDSGVETGSLQLDAEGHGIRFSASSTPCFVGRTTLMAHKELNAKSLADMKCRLLPDGPQCNSAAACQVE